MGTVARHWLVETVRAARLIGRPSYVLLFAIAAMVFLFTSNNGRPQLLLPSVNQFTATASATALDTAQSSARPPGPWSRIVGSPQFEKITDVTVMPDGDLVFAAMTLGVVQGERSEAILIHTSASGHVHSQAPVRDPELGSISGGTLDAEGRARFIHWQGTDPAFAMTDRDGTMIWSRTFGVTGLDVWAEIAPAEQGETIAAIADGYGNGSVRIVRLDAAGKVLWRHVVPLNGDLGRLKLADSGDGGAVIAYDQHRPDVDASGTVDLLRLTRRGRLAWARTIATGTGEGALADLVATPDGAVVLTTGAVAGLYSFDPLGELIWVRDAPALKPGGQHVLARGPDASVHLLAETVSENESGRHWLARFDTDGRLDRSTVRANRMNATFEAVELMGDGTLIAAGSLIASTSGDTDMVMLSVDPAGAFPQGYGTVDRSSPSVRMVERASPDPGTQIDTPAPVLAAVQVADMQLAAEIVRREPAVRTMIRSTPISAAPDVAPASASLSLAAASPPASETPAQRTIAMTSGPAQPQPAAQNPSPSTERDVTRAVSEIASARNQSSVRAASAETYAYECTFSCLAASRDLVKYPVSRVIRDVSEENASLVSLDLLAMDRSICSSTGGRVFDQPRLPPKCTRVD